MAGEEIRCDLTREHPPEYAVEVCYRIEGIGGGEGDPVIAPDTDGVGGRDSGMVGHLNIPVVVPDEPRVCQIKVVGDSGAVDHFWRRFPAITGSLQMGAGLDIEESGTGFFDQAILHFGVDVGEVTGGHEAFGDALLAGDEDGGKFCIVDGA